MPFLALAALLVAQSAPNPSATPRCHHSDPVVWVNTSSHVYHMQGTKYYGNTKSGKYMCKSAADTAGDHAAKNEQPGSGAAPAATATPKHSWFSHPRPTPTPEGD
jgi:hypothetical protein